MVVHAYREGGSPLGDCVRLGPQVRPHRPVSAVPAPTRRLGGPLVGWLAGLSPWMWALAAQEFELLSWMTGE